MEKATAATAEERKIRGCCFFFLTEYQSLNTRILNTIEYYEHKLYKGGVRRTSDLIVFHIAAANGMTLRSSARRGEGVPAVTAGTTMLR
jgi:hypothetical protein